MSQNFLSPLEFRFSLSRAPNIEYYIQQVSLPSVSTGSIIYPTPFNNLNITPDKLEYGDLTITYRVDEDMLNYQEILGWMKGHAFPDNFTQYKALKDAKPGSEAGIYSDATLTFLNSTKNPNIVVQYENIFPTSLSEITMDVRNSDIQYVEATTTFKYDRFTISTV